MADAPGSSSRCTIVDKTIESPASLIIAVAHAGNCVRRLGSSLPVVRFHVSCKIVPRGRPFELPCESPGKRYWRGG